MLFKCNTCHINLKSTSRYELHQKYHRNTPGVTFQCIIPSAKYPGSFQDKDDDGVVIGDGSATIFCRLRERASYLRRPHKRKIYHQDDTSVPPQLSRKKACIMSGCTNWAPPRPDEMHINSILEVKEILKSQTFDNYAEDLYEMLEKTFAEQRAFLNNINKPPSVTDILREWPIIFNMKAISWHFGKTTSSNLENLSLNLQQKADKIIQYGIDKKLITPEVVDESKDSKVEKVLEVIANYFKEPINHFLMIPGRVRLSF